MELNVLLFGLCQCMTLGLEVSAMALMCVELIAASLLSSDAYDFHIEVCQFMPLNSL
jgi:hypothetical protein